MVFQWNKRDLRNVVPVEELEATFNLKGTPSFQSVASDGLGVFETLRGITKLALTHIKTNVLGESQAAPPPAPLAPAPLAPRSAGEALTLSDLPSVSDLLDMEGSTAPAAASFKGSMPLPDEDEDTNLFIEAPNLPEPPQAVRLGPSLMSPDESLMNEVEAMPLPAGGAGMGVDELAFLMPDGPEPEVESNKAPVVAIPERASLAAPVPAPLVPGPGSAAPVPKLSVRMDPMAALASLKLETRRPATKPRPVDPKDAINSLMGELTQAGRSGAPSVLRLELPPDAEGEIEVVVQVRRQGQLLVEGQIHRPVPGKGITAKLSVELKRG
jgi:hypothetical protein